MRHVLTFMAVSFLSVSSAAGQLVLGEAGDSPDQRVTVTMPGVYRAAVWQASGGGIMEFYDLAHDPKAEYNLVCRNRGLFEIGWPVETKQLFDRHMRHDGRSVNWDRAGYGSNGIVMDPGYDSTWACLIQFGTKDHPLAAEFKTAAESIPWASSYRRPARISGATLVSDDAGDFNRDGFNESEGCHVLTGSAPLRFTYERGEAAGFAPAFKVLGWKGEAPGTVKVDGQAIPAAAAVVDGRLILQVLGRINAAKATLEIGENLIRR